MPNVYFYAQCRAFYGPCETGWATSGRKHVYTILSCVSTRINTSGHSELTTQRGLVLTGKANFKLLTNNFSPHHGTKRVSK